VAFAAPDEEDKVGAAPQGGFLGWTATYGQYLGFYVQLAYWIVLAASAAWAAVTFARYVKFMTTDDGLFEDTAQETFDTPIDEFVE
jgi:hypothetical protein